MRGRMERNVARLEEIFDLWNVDKAQPASRRRAKAEWRGYTGVYECLFRRHRRDCRSVLEIGIGTMIPNEHSSMAGSAVPGYKPGGSLRAWRDYFENATIFGIDVQPDTQFDEPRIVTRLCDSTNAESVQSLMQEGDFPSEFDVIIDDASHVVTDQLATLANFFPYLKNEGFYIVEDLSDATAALQFVDQTDRVREICGNHPFFFLGPFNNLCVVMKRGELENEAL